MKPSYEELEAALRKAEQERDALRDAGAEAVLSEMRKTQQAEQERDALRANHREAREAFQLVREVVEDLASPGSVAEVIEPPFTLEAEALAKGIRDIDRRAGQAEARQQQL